MIQLRMIKQWAIFVAFLFGVFANALSANEQGVSQALVVYDSSLYDLNNLGSVNSEVASLVSDLKNKHGFELTLQSYSDEELSLFVADEPRYDHLILLPSAKKAIGDKKGFNQHQLMEFINREGNIFVVGSDESVLPDDVRTFLNEMGIYPAPKGFKYIDHFNSVKGTPQLTNENIVNKKVLGEFTEGEHEYKGTGALISNNENIFPIVRSSKTGFTTDEVEETLSQEKTWTFGQQGFLAVGFQGFNNARLTWVGSESLINDDLLKWTFQEKNVLKLQFVQHYKSENPEFIDNKLYRIKDQVIYTVGVSEFANDKWIPYEIKDEEDNLQLAFKMLDPYQRVNLQPLGPGSSKEDGNLEDLYIYYANFTVPDQHGIFTFDLDYKRSGLSYIVDKRVVTVRHLANDEYKRSWDIPNSWLYVASAVLVVLGWFLFVVNFLYVGNTNTTKKNV
ncbi:uncharacterized protein AC631_02761 [Debaryomyces fabryi]|uniref:Dolichyl-diphosphooligosaccharide--protein glycosyltransferase subunit WBP1 n=1 Tax=Debaryomyces fabryi TaxID=58627 RepID=A0A0V1PYY0_9ASCO|nr:uncharacterized protein AC631_02761 [Debaryomyces fabryi]KSA01467.1 hypothetical protein AC631_02761 [Debaryomyces fabryi]CUM57417.1 unnamed protein product [Debaryomyces fabryi]